ncbi:MAG TPA: hypothetical protein VFL98_02760 [Candidatus Paceibacterota bacterium]|nr:hypothetical protein [Candidatus Paceibacterota bacterium]
MTRTPATRTWLIAFATIAIFMLPGGSQAISLPLGLSGTQYLLSLAESPAAPAPGETVLFTLSSTAIDLPSATISWYLDGTAEASGVGVTTFATQSGAAGSTHTVSVVAEGSDGTAAETKATLRPAAVSLQWEADSYVPPFYRGRALPAAGTSVTVHADAQLVGSGGAALPASSIRYQWSVNGTPRADLSGNGRDTITIAGPMPHGALVVAVTASADDGTYQAAAQTRIAAVTPVLDLYAADPLLGIRYGDALSNGSTLSAGKATIALAPYYMAAASPDSSALSYRWEVNGDPVLADPGTPSRLTLALSGGAAGAAAVSLALSDSLAAFQSASGAWQLMVSANAASTPFGSAAKANPF